MFRPQWVCPIQGCLCFPVYTAQAPGCSIWSGPCVECGSSFRVLHKSVDSVAPAFCVFPGLAAQATRGLGALSPDAAHLFPPRRAAQAARGLGALSLDAAHLFPPRPQRALPVGAGRVPAACICSEELASSGDPPGEVVLNGQYFNTL